MRSLSLAAFSDFITFCLSKQNLGASPLAMLLSSLECHCVIISVPIVIDLLGVYFDVFHAVLILKFVIPFHKPPSRMSADRQLFGSKDWFRKPHPYSLHPADSAKIPGMPPASPPRLHAADQQP